MIDEISALNKNQVVGHTLKLNPVNVTQYLHDIINDVRVAYPSSAEISLECDLPDCIHMLDETLLDNIFTNLISNAVKYSPDEGKIHVGIIHDDENFIVTIADNGIGIPESDQRYVFSEPIHRALNVGNISGSGLGHIIVKQAVDAHGGTITFESEESKGTTFIVTIPLLIN